MTGGGQCEERAMNSSVHFLRREAVAGGRLPVNGNMGRNDWPLKLDADANRQEASLVRRRGMRANVQGFRYTRESGVRDMQNGATGKGLRRHVAEDYRQGLLSVVDALHLSYDCGSLSPGRPRYGGELLVRVPWHGEGASLVRLVAAGPLAQDSPKALVKKDAECGFRGPLFGTHGGTGSGK